MADSSSSDDPPTPPQQRSPEVQREADGGETPALKHEANIRLGFGYGPGERRILTEEVDAIDRYTGRHPDDFRKWFRGSGAEIADVQRRRSVFLLQALFKLPQFKPAMVYRGIQTTDPLSGKTEWAVGDVINRDVLTGTSLDKEHVVRKYLQVRMRPRATVFHYDRTECHILLQWKPKDACMIPKELHSIFFEQEVDEQEVLFRPGLRLKISDRQLEEAEEGELPFW